VNSGRSFDSDITALTVLRVEERYEDGGSRTLRNVS
jgi:hypothetical protein